MNAKKDTYSALDALELLNSVSQLYAAKGKKFVRINLRKDRPTDDELKKLIVGPSGNLRAPTLRKGKTMVVGFHPEMYDQLFG